MRVLLAEDDRRLGRVLTRSLTERGFVIDWREDGIAARDAVREADFDLLLLDLNLPGCSGREVLAGVRRRDGVLPVLVLTARSDVDTRVRVLDGGADDYLVKPFDLEELCARMRALLRRAGGGYEPLVAGDVALDPRRHTVTRGGAPVSLAPREFALLRLLLENAGRVCQRAVLEERLYGQGEDVASNAVEVHVHHLRRKLGSDLVTTIRGVGYMVERGR